MTQMSALRAPSSGPSGHLLPAGEKREFAVASPFSAAVSKMHLLGSNLRRRQRRRDLFSPAGRRWRVAPDEGAPEARTITRTNTTWGETT
ncbi:hypothetical protein C0075_08845 [Rhizobium sp. KAs_5_22]|nr:hypothetical protein C0075_08845 [Rhizobium sp. KAs_5_22]